MLRAIWNGAVIAEAPQTVPLEGNHYVPPESVNQEYLRASQTTTVCPWKGVAHYYQVVVNGEVNPDAARYYPKPSPHVRKIKNHVAFWNRVTVEGRPEPARPRNSRAERYGPREILRNFGR